MALMFMMILSVAGVAIALSLYSLFTPYFSLLKDIKHYNMAYYGANMAMERSLLVLRQQGPGFEGTGGWQWSVGHWPVSDHGALPSLAGLESTVLWSIRSRSSLKQNKHYLPGDGLGNDLYDQRMNTITHGQTVRIPLWIDLTNPSSAYKNDGEVRTIKSSMNSLILRLVLPPSLYYREGFWSLCDADSSPCSTFKDLDEDGVDDDVIVSWRMDGRMGRNSFTILPRQVIGKFDGDQNIGVKQKDSMIRESSINAMKDSYKMVLFADGYNPIAGINPLMSGSEHLIISPVWFNFLKNQTFHQIFSHNSIEKLSLTLTLTNQLRAQGGQIYPFLSYQLIGDRSPFAQPYFFLQGVGKVGDYTVTMKAIKPIDKQNLLSSFTVIF